MASIWSQEYRAMKGLVLIIRGEYDGIAAEPDLLDFLRGCHTRISSL